VQNVQLEHSLFADRLATSISAGRQLNRTERNQVRDEERQRSGTMAEIKACHTDRAIPSTIGGSHPGALSEKNCQRCCHRWQGCACGARFRASAKRPLCRWPFRIRHCSGQSARPHPQASGRTGHAPFLPQSGRRWPLSSVCESRVL